MRRFTGAMATVAAEWPALVIELGHLPTPPHLLGLRTIVESERFNRTLLVRSEDRRFATALLDARMME